MLVASDDAVITSKTQSTICEFAGMITLVAVAASAPPANEAAKLCAITTCPVFFMLVPTVVPVVFEIVPAFIGPEKVVVAILYSS